MLVIKMMFDTIALIAFVICHFIGKNRRNTFCKVRSRWLAVKTSATWFNFLHLHVHLSSTNPTIYCHRQFHRVVVDYSASHNFPLYTQVCTGCAKCAKGQYQDNLGRKYCKECAFGKFASEQGGRASPVHSLVYHFLPSLVQIQFSRLGSMFPWLWLARV